MGLFLECKNKFREIMQEADQLQNSEGFVERDKYAERGVPSNNCRRNLRELDL